MPAVGRPIRRYFVSGFCRHCGDSFTVVVAERGIDPGNYCKPGCRRQGYQRRVIERRGGIRCPVGCGNTITDRELFCQECWQHLKAMCKRKLRWPDGEVAATALASMRKDPVMVSPDRLQHYRCDLCEQWHIGNAFDDEGHRDRQRRVVAVLLERTNREYRLDLAARWAPKHAVPVNGGSPLSRAARRAAERAGSAGALPGVQAVLGVADGDLADAVLPLHADQV